ncbi:MAG TPA: hypothetical protein VMR52_13195 [Dehalococcoidia bacterium]|nr:hypothetical protein [Dehalococcoidia bacterium]
MGEPLTGHEDWVASVAFSPDGAILASADDDVRLWDVATHRQIGEPRYVGSVGSVGSVTFSPDGVTLAWATGGPHGGIVELWTHPTFEAACALALAIFGAPLPAVPEFLRDKGVDRWACEEVAPAGG